MSDDSDEFDSLVGMDTGSKREYRKIAAEVIELALKRSNMYSVIYAPYVPYCLLRDTIPHK